MSIEFLEALKYGWVICDKVLKLAEIYHCADGFRFVLA